MNGADIRKLSTKTQAQHRAFFLPQNTDTSFNFSVKDIIQMPMTLSRLSPAQQKELTAYCLEITNSEAFSERAYLPLSGGEKQRIQLSRVIAQLFSHPEPYPHFLLLDEPISALDLRHQYTILQRLKTLCQQKKPFPVSVILVLHDINLAALFCDKILLLHQTQAIAYGTPEKVLTKAQIEEVFRIKAHLHVHPDTQTPFFIPKI
ncbi:hemin import ATP-binding protein HmuV-like [Lepeophtheirus salmonis]|uniref:hemin import ATP-binding protein HmuV-like n=1 Tax=Lepeophtheirus salmonis TaxID=72036 RepID=UPI001AE9DC74|nr:hemin import ATP-binding protein HmuV-like [Lepeophtheirus salmonis]